MIDFYSLATTKIDTNDFWDALQNLDQSELIEVSLRLKIFTAMAEQVIQERNWNRANT